MRDAGPTDEIATRSRGLDAETAEQLAVFGLGFVLCLAVRLWTLNDNFWELELVAASTIELGWGSMLAERIINAEPPLYYVLLKFLGLTGESNFALRMPSAILDSLACGLLAWVAGRTSGRVGAVAFVLTFALMPVLLRFGQEARPYPLLCFFFAVALAASREVWRAPKVAVLAIEPGATTGQKRMRGLLATVALAMVGAGWTMVIGWLVVAVMQASILASPRLLRVPGFLWTWLILCGAVWACILPAIVLVAPHMTHFWETVWVPDTYVPSFAAMVGDIRASYGWPVDADPNRFFPAGWEGYLGLALFALALVSVARRNPPSPLRQASFIALGVALVLYVPHAFRALVPLRYIQPSLWCLCLLYADGAAQIARQWIGRAILAVLSLAVVLQGLDGLTAPRKVDWTPFLGFFFATHMEAYRGYVTDPGLALAITRSLPTGASAPRIDILPDPSAFRAAVQSAMSRDDPVWILTARPAPAIIASLPQGVALCTTAISYHTFFIVARHPAAFPEAIRGCLSGQQTVR